MSIITKRHAQFGMPPKERTIVKPYGGWKAHTLYLVEVAHLSTNPIHHAYLKVGFLYEEEPAGYSYVWSKKQHTDAKIWMNTYDGVTDMRDIHYLRVVRKLHTEVNDESNN